LEQLEELFVRYDVPSSLPANKLPPTSDVSVHLAVLDDHGWKVILIVYICTKELDAVFSGRPAKVT
jgi:hypothetical protein